MKKEKSFYDKTLAAIVTHIADGALIVDKHGKVLEMNNALQRMTGWLPADVVGKQSCFALFGCRNRDDAPGQEVCCSGFKSPPWPGLNDGGQVIDLVTSTGKKIRARISCAPLPNVGPDAPVAIILVRSHPETS